MLNIKKFLKGLRILNSADQSKALELGVDNAATTGTKTTLNATQTANVTQSLPDGSGTVLLDSLAQDITNKTITLSNATDNKMLVSEASTHKIVDSTITHIDNTGNTELSVAGKFTITAPATKEVILAGKALRIPLANFLPSALPTGNLGEIVYNTADEAIWLYTTLGYVPLISDSGANKNLSNLVAPTSINQQLIPDVTGKDLGTPALRWDGNFLQALVDNLTVETEMYSLGPAEFYDNVSISGNLTVGGTTVTLNTATLDVEDVNITVNKGGSDVSSEGAGLTVDRVSTDGSLVYADALASKFKIGALGAESEILSAATAQTITGEKTLQNLLNLPSVNDATTNTVLTLAGGAVTRITNTKPSITSITGLSAGSFGLLVNASAGSITFAHEDAGVVDPTERILTSTGTSYIVPPNSSVIYYRDSVTARTRLLWVNPTFTEETLEFKLNGSYYNSADTFPIAAIDGLTVLPYNIIITNIFLYNVVAGTGGSTSMRLYKKDVVGAAYTNLFSTDPAITSAAVADAWIGVGETVAGCTAPVLNGSSQLITAKSILKCDLQSAMTGAPEDCGLVVHYLKL